MQLMWVSELPILSLVRLANYSALRFLKTQINFEKVCEVSFFKIYLYNTKPKQAVINKETEDAANLHLLFLWILFERKAL